MYDRISDLAAKCDYEGGIYEFFYSYGVSQEELSPDLKRLWPAIKEFKEACVKFEDELDKTGFFEEIS